MINLNGQILPGLPDQLLDIQRAAYYGDGVFETIRAFNGKIPFWDHHWARLMRGMLALEMEPPANWSSSFLTEEIRKTGIANSRIRLMVWREPGGLFMPESRLVHYLITVQPLDAPIFEWKKEGISTVFCSSIKLPVDELSGIKLLGGARYVKAAMESRRRGADDGLLFNTEHRICEAVSSNICWIKDAKLYYPPPGEGQVAGTTQEHLLALALENGWQVIARPCFRDDLLEADEILLTNAIQGLRWIRSLDGKTYGCDCTKKIYTLFTRDLKRRLEQPGSV
ncbi:MAG: aminotransferase class IV [Saprospiraceae bacterium]|nr:aminotransferase class IV [Saprospiraceae bacterium]